MGNEIFLLIYFILPHLAKNTFYFSYTQNGQKALEMANSSSFGLGAVIFTKNKELGKKWARDYIRDGSCYVNGMVKSNPSLPFGGINDSGYGRELSVEGIREFTNIKTIAICR